MFLACFELLNNNANLQRICAPVNGMIYFVLLTCLANMNEKVNHSTQHVIENGARHVGNTVI